MDWLTHSAGRGNESIIIKAGGAPLPLPSRPAWPPPHQPQQVPALMSTGLSECVGSSCGAAAAAEP